MVRHWAKTVSCQAATICRAGGVDQDPVYVYWQQAVVGTTGAQSVSMLITSTPQIIESGVVTYGPGSYSLRIEGADAQTVLRWGMVHGIQSRLELMSCHCGSNGSASAADRTLSPSVWVHRGADEPPASSEPA